MTYKTVISLVLLFASASLLADFQFAETSKQVVRSYLDLDYHLRNNRLVRDIDDSHDATATDRGMASIEDAGSRLKALTRFKQTILEKNIYYIQSNVAYVDKEKFRENGISSQDITRLIFRANALRDKLTSYIAKEELVQFKRYLRRLSESEFPDVKRSAALLAQILSTIEVSTISIASRKSTEKLFREIYQTYSKKLELKQCDCKVLEQTYRLWSSFYRLDNDDDNDDERGDTEGPAFYNVNSHNASYFHWYQEKNKGLLPDDGLPLVHFDTHSDASHISAHNHQSIFSGIPFYVVTHFSDLLAREGRPGLIKHVNRLKLAPLIKTNIINLLKGMSMEDIDLEITNYIRGSVHLPAQPMVAAVTSGVTSDITFALPPWSLELPRSEVKDGKAVKQNLMLIESEGNIHLTYSKSHDPLGISSIPQALIYELSEFGFYSLLRNNILMSVTDSHHEHLPDKSEYRNSFGVEGIESLAAHLNSSSFILDIDLDVFSSEGINDQIGEPTSFERTEPFMKNTDLDGRVLVEVSSKELTLVKKRVQAFNHRLQEAKSQGHQPEIITIADSTLLESLYTANEYDTASGGIFTPSCLVFLLNYSVRQIVEDLYIRKKAANE